MQHRRKPASSAAPTAAKPSPSRRPTALLSHAGLVVAIFLVAIFLYSDAAAANKPAETVAVAAGRARSPDLRVLHQQHEEELGVGWGGEQAVVVRDVDAADHKRAQATEEERGTGMREGGRQRG
jgi:hypothetical protein